MSFFSFCFHFICALSKRKSSKYMCMCACVCVLRKIVVDTWIAFGFPSACLWLLKAHHISASNPFHGGKPPHLSNRLALDCFDIRRRHCQPRLTSPHHTWALTYLQASNYVCTIYSIYIYINYYGPLRIWRRYCCCCWYLSFMACHFKNCCCGKSSEQL